MEALQKAIHGLEVGGGMRHLRTAILVLGVLLCAILYDGRAFKNMSSQEAMDAAQLARNIAAGDGYTTLFIRPLSIHLLQSKRQSGQAGLGVGNAEDSGLKGMHPDLANPPVYPCVLAGLMWLLDHTRVMAFHFPIPAKSPPFWGRGGQFWWYQPDFLIAMLNQFLFLCLLILVYRLARRLFDRSVAWLSVVVLFSTELLWRFSVSGLSTMLLLVIFAGVAWTLVLLDEQTREPKWGAPRVIGLAAVAGLLIGIGGLTRYAFGFLIIPVLLFVILFAGRQRFVLAVAAFLAFAAVMTPWIVRNYNLCGAPFGTASYTVLESTSFFPEYKLQRSLQPDMTQVNLLLAFRQKLFGNAKAVVQNDLPKLGGNWISAFFLAGLLLAFRNPGVRRLRYFLGGCLVVLAIVQALGRTQLSEDSPELNSENLLVLVAPLVLVYGVSLFYLLLEQMQLSFRELRYVAVAIFAFVAGLPLVLTFLGNPASPFTFPPYYPPSIQSSVGYIKGVGPGKGHEQTDPGELMISDIPWAIAWYGYSQCAWLPLTTTDFFAINDFRKPINAMYVTSLMLEKRDRADLQGSVQWGTIFNQAAAYQFDVMVGRKDNEWNEDRPRHVNFGFNPSLLPLHYWQSGWPSFLLLTSRQHWPKDS